jgi:NAD(P)-dependent dehydrogenase (short-subunit alcohol dehydrogenase family)
MVQHKRWFVTSSSRGFGRIWTEAALARGDKVAATALGDLVETYGNAILPFSLDVTDRNAVFAAVEDAHAHFGRLHVILYNAGYGYMGAVEEVVEADAHTNFDTNVFGTLSVIQTALPIFRAQRSWRILTVSSIGVSSAFPRADLCSDKICHRGNVRSPFGRSGVLRRESDDHRTGKFPHRVPVVHQGCTANGGV